MKSNDMHEEQRSELARCVASAYEALDSAQKEQAATVLAHVMTYYADPGTYFALGIGRDHSHTGSGALGDFIHDYGDEVDGGSASIKPGQLARAAHDALMKAAGEDVVDWQGGIEWWPEGIFKLVGVDVGDRQDRMTAESDERYRQALADYQAEQDARNVEQYECVCHANSDVAVHADFELHPHPTGRTDYQTKEVVMVMPDACPCCESPTQDGRPSDQPTTQQYLCGARAYSCGHVTYWNEGSRELCAYIKETS